MFQDRPRRLAHVRAEKLLQVVDRIRRRSHADAAQQRQACQAKACQTERDIPRMPDFPHGNLLASEVRRGRDLASRRRRAGAAEYARRRRAPPARPSSIIPALCRPRHESPGKSVTIRRGDVPRNHKSEKIGPPAGSRPSRGPNTAALLDFRHESARECGHGPPNFATFTNRRPARLLSSCRQACKLAKLRRKEDSIDREKRGAHGQSFVSSLCSCRSQRGRRTVFQTVPAIPDGLEIRPTRNKDA